MIYRRVIFLVSAYLFTVAHCANIERSSKHGLTFWEIAEVDAEICASFIDVDHRKEARLYAICHDISNNELVIENVRKAIRVCNSMTAKEKEYIFHYCNIMSHVDDLYMAIERSGSAELKNAILRRI
jgi:uncharacterized DUF497 family protein